MSTIFFLAKMILISGLLFIYYFFFLRNKKFHQYNRFYLLSIPVISICIPLMNIPVPGFYFANQHATIKLLNVVGAANWEDIVTITPQHNYLLHFLSWRNITWAVFIIVALTLLIALLKNLLYIKRISSKYPRTEIEKINFYQTDEPGTPFSFFNHIFWNNRIDAGSEKGRQIFRHEMYHVKQKHSADILFIEIMTAIFWLNPFFHLIKKEIKTVHEFLADQFAASETNHHVYAELLVLSVAARNHFQIANPFYNNQIKRRIAMLTQLKKTRYGYISRLMSLPLLFILFCAFAVKLGSIKNVKKVLPSKTITVVIDAGHGGIDQGTRNSAGALEKNISLQIAEKIKELSKEYNVNVVMTRETDELPGNATNIKDGLLNRVRAVSENNADAFISIHMNADQMPVTDKSGFEIFIPKYNSSPFYERSMILGSAIGKELKNFYITNEQLKQYDKNAVVLNKNEVPSILLECGYINNKKDFDFISSPSNQEKLARNILEGILKYNAFLNQGSEIKKDTISPEESKIDIQSIKSMDVFKNKNTIIIKLKNGDSVIMKINEYKEYNDSVKKTANQEDDDKIFTKVEVEAEYPGGRKAWADYLSKNLKYPEDAVKRKIQGTVLAQFVVDTDGSLSNIKILERPDASLSEVSYKVIKNSGKWIPAMQNGKKVKSYKKQPIVFKLEAK